VLPINSGSRSHDDILCVSLYICYYYWPVCQCQTICCHCSFCRVLQRKSVYVGLSSRSQAPLYAISFNTVRYTPGNRGHWLCFGNPGSTNYSFDNLYIEPERIQCQKCKQQIYPYAMVSLITGRKLRNKPCMTFAQEPWISAARNDPRRFLHQTGWSLCTRQVHRQSDKRFGACKLSVCGAYFSIATHKSDLTLALVCSALGIGLWMIWNLPKTATSFLDGVIPRRFLNLAVTISLQ
jgi:hypothetical protein